MVSTRQCSTKFSVGETVLCFEPDTSKAKVLYESKVLETDFTKDEKGKKVPEYFVHFSGWNKSWDRWVLEDQVLQGNEVNRLKMKRLHEEAVICLKNKKRRKSLMETPDPCQLEPLTESPCAIPQQLQPVTTPNSPSVPCIEIEIPSSLKLKLEDDCYFIKRKKKLVRLPRSPNVLDILKEYIDHFTLQEDQTVPEAKSSVTIVKEVMDGLRIYFDFTLPSLLLYNFEREQYQQVMESAAMKENCENGSNLKEQSDERSVVEEVEKENTETTVEEVKQEKNETIKLRKSLSTPEPSAEHAKQDDKSSDRVLRSKRQKPSSALAGSASCSSTVSSSSGEREESLNVPCEVNEASVERGVKRKLSDVTSNEDRVSVKPVPEKAPTNLPSNTSTTSARSSSTQTAPSLIYGAEHLLRLFVKLPSLLAKTTIQENRRSLLLHHLTDFLAHLSSRSSTLFSEDVYQDIIL